MCVCVCTLQSYFITIKKEIVNNLLHKSACVCALREVMEHVEVKFSGSAAA